MAPRPAPTERLLAATDEGVLSSLLPLFQAAPLVGVEYIVEILVDNDDPIYSCLLCKFRADVKELLYHLMSAQHRMSYLVISFLLFHLKWFIAHLFPIYRGRFSIYVHCAVNF